MNFADLKTYFKDRYLTFSVRTNELSEFSDGDFVNVVSEEIALIKNTNSLNAIKCEFLNEKERVEFEKCSLGKYFIQIESINGKLLTLIMLYDLQINYSIDSGSEINISVYDKALKRKNIDELNLLLAQNYTINIDCKNYCIFGTHKYSTDEERAFILIDAKNRKYLSISKKHAFEISNNSNNSSDIAYCIDKSESSLRNVENYSLYLYDGKISFNDESTIKKCSVEMEAFLSKKSDVYIRMWRAYSESEYTMEIENAQNAGVLEYSKCESTEKANQFKFYLDNNQQKLIKFIKYSVDVQGRIQVLLRRGKIKRKAELINNISPTDNFVLCEMKDNAYPFKSGSIEIDTDGSELMHARRIYAFDRIEEVDGNKAANMCIAKLLEGEQINSYNKKIVNDDDIVIDDEIITTQFTNNGKFYPPNPSQREAIKIALSTPDFAIIQGPPGTGKTKVIHAIHAHMQKYEKNPELRNRKYLLTAHQRDATKNLADNVDKNGLPIIAEYGQKNDDLDESVIEWRKKIINELEKKHQSSLMEKQLKSTIVLIKSLKNSIDNELSIERARDIVDQIIHIAEEFVCKIKSNEEFFEKTDFSTVDEIYNSLNSLRRYIKLELMTDEFSTENEWKIQIKKLPTSSREIQDNAKEIIKEFIKYFERFKFVSGMEEQINILKDLDINVVNKELISKLKAVRVNMILLMDRKNCLKIDTRDNLAKKIDDVISCMSNFRFNDKSDILSEYYDNIQSDFDVMNTIKKYQEIVAATHQKSLDIKNPTDYKDILIDEAARSCPADLLIPLASTENRMILVGDHKQLPQYVEEDILRNLITNCSENELYDCLDDCDDESIKQRYKASMFEYLIDKVKKMESTDGIKRFITLDTQYRMPPILGDLVSRQFYKDEQLSNGISDSKMFSQDYPGISGKNMIWINMPTSQGMQKPSKTGSAHRKCEAEIIVKYVMNIFPQLKGKDKIGVITFYKAQKIQILKLLEYYLNKDGRYNLSEVLQKIEIGTVDAFQGKEFAIVFLSTVITNKDSKWGFLNSKNRMCVALSRAKKCMIVVGNSDIFNYKQIKKDKNGQIVKKSRKPEYVTANDEIPALIDFYKTCELYEKKEGSICAVIK